MVLEDVPFEAIQNGYHGNHLGYQNDTILAILKLQVALMPPAKFKFGPTYGSRSGAI